MKILKPITVSENKDLTDTELFEKMSNNLNAKESKAAFNEFFDRYHEYLWKTCSYVCKNQGLSSEITTEIYQSTLIKVYTKSSTYKGNIGIKAWLGTIAKNELVNHHRENNNGISFHPIAENFDIPDTQNELEDSTPSELMLKLNGALSTLTDQDKDILLTYMRYYDPQYPTRHLPTNEMHHLCHTYNLTSDNIRQKKGRIFKKLKALLI